ncbi:unnamed protein product [Anisakis simplex]|uniref:Diacylglycerol kinase theta (inferred by orthology to a human protein) n=1 Tax=Anisakis simplex TaxID=6269 RepID=A0A0M3J4E4_ANISI|nr:unnamed protein product [Anisakis simplex]
MSRSMPQNSRIILQWRCVTIDQIAHTWSEPSHIKRRFCCVCRKRTDDTLTVECEVCEYYVHVDCQDLAVSDCKEAATFVPNVDKVIFVIQF